MGVHPVIIHFNYFNTLFHDKPSSYWGSPMTQKTSIYVAGWWFLGKTPLKKTRVRQLRDDNRNPILMGKYKIDVPNHQPDKIHSSKDVARH